MSTNPPRELLRWRCRRGMKELDLLLERFLQSGYDHAPPERQRAFEHLLTLPDPLIAELLLGPAGTPDAHPPGASPADAGPADARPTDAAASPGDPAPPGLAKAGPGDAHLSAVLALVAARMAR